MSNNSEEEPETGITDDQLPEDLVRPSRIDPSGLTDLLEEGKGAEGDQDDTQESDEYED